MTVFHPWPGQTTPPPGCVVTVQTIDGELVEAMYDGNSLWTVGVDGDPLDQPLNKSVSGWFAQEDNQ